MASTGTYGDPDAQLGGGSGIYVSQNGGTPPAQQQPQHLHTDPDLQLRENLQQLQHSNEMMHPGPSQHQMGALNPAHHHFQTPPRPTHSPQHMAQSAQSVMGLDDHNPYGDHDSVSRKRSKVSRACDECRRKKIRCDATSENGPEACSSCKRTGARCQFSRQPMKRGPSKGYIKELADRLNSLENQIQQPHAPSQGYDFAIDSSLGDAQTPSQFTRKRTHSMSENFQDPYTRPNWSGQDRELPLNGTPAGNNRRVSFGEMTLAGNLITGSNEATIKAYYNIVHPTLPLLPQDSTSLNLLTHCPPKLRETFFLTLECSIRSFAPRILPYAELSLNSLLHQCFEAVDSAKYTLADADGSRQFFNHVVYCQSLLFLTVASDRPGPSTIGSPTDLLGQIAGCINKIGLNDTKILTPLREQDYEMYEAARRTFSIALILDRFHASSRSKDLTLPLNSGSVLRDDYSALGEVGYHLARAANIVGHVASSTRAGTVPKLDPSSPNAFAGSMATSPLPYINGWLAGFREPLEVTGMANSSPPYLAYQYVRILVARLSEDGSSTEILSLTKELLGNLANGTVTPLHHIFASLVATSLSDLSDRVETQIEAHASIKEMSDALGNGQIIQRSPDGLGWDTAIQDLLHQKKAPTPPNALPEQTSPALQPNMAGLQHLAAAAVGEREGADARPASSGGNGTASSNQPKVDHDLQAAVAAANEAAKAQATAAAAQQQMQNTSSNGNNYDPSALVKDGFMSALT